MKYVSGNRNIPVYRDHINRDICSILDIYNHFFLTAQTLTITSIPSGATYVKLGESLTLDVTYNYTGDEGVRVEWSKLGENVLVRKLADGRIKRFDKRAFVKGEASLVLRNTELNDNGTYRIILLADDVSSPTGTRS